MKMHTAKQFELVCFDRGDGSLLGSIDFQVIHIFRLVDILYVQLSLLLVSTCKVVPSFCFFNKGFLPPKYHL